MRPLGILLACAALAGAQDADLVSRTYDIRVLTHGETPRRGPHLRLQKAPAESVVIADEPAGQAMEAEVLLRVLQAMTGPERWGGVNTMELGDAGWLRVRTTPGVQARVAAALETLARLTSRRVAVDARLLFLAPGVLEGAGAETGVLNAGQEKALLEAAADGKRGTTAAVLTGSAPPDVWSFAADVRERRLVADFDIEIANGSAIARPVSRLVLDGAVLDFRAELDPDGGRLLLEYRFAAARRGTTREFNGGAKPEGALSLPSRPLFEARGAFCMPSGKPVLMLPGAVDGVEGGWTAAVLLRARRIEEPIGSLPLAAEGVQLRFMEVGSLIRGAANAPGSRLRLGDLPGTQAPIEFPIADDEDVTDGAEALQSFLRRALGEEAFTEGGSELSACGDRLLVAMKEPHLDAVEKLLRDTSTAAMRNVTVDAAVVEIDPARRRGLAPAELLELARAGDGARVLARSGILGFADLRIASFAGAESLFVREREVEVAQRAAATHPWLDTLTEGLCLTVCAGRTGREGRAQIDLRTEYGSNPGLSRIETGAVPGGAMEESTLDLFTCTTSLELGAGEWTVAGEGLQPPGNDTRTLRVLLVRVRYPETR